MKIDPSEPLTQSDIKPPPIIAAVRLRQEKFKRDIARPIFFLLIIIAIAALCVWMMDIPNDTDSRVLLISLWMLTILVAIIWWRIKRSNEQLANDLVNEDLLGIVNDILDAMELAFGKVTKQKLRDKLIYYFRTMESGQFSQLSYRHRLRLRKYISSDLILHGLTDEFLTSLIDCLSRYGDKTDCRALDRLARINSPRENIIEHARVRLAQMEQRMREGSQMSRLLRPSQPDQDLLRPASSPGLEDTDQLLRPIVDVEPTQPRPGSDA